MKQLDTTRHHTINQQCPRPQSGLASRLREETGRVLGPQSEYTRKRDGSSGRKATRKRDGSSGRKADHASGTGPEPRPRLCRGASGTRRPVPFNPPIPPPAADRREAANRPSLNPQRGVSPGRMSRPCSRAQPGGRKRECTSERSQDGEANARRIGLGSPRAAPPPNARIL